MCQNPLRENDNGIKFGIAKIKTIPDILEFIMPKCSHYHTILFHLTTAKLKRKWPYIVLDLKKICFIYFQTQKKSANKYQIKQQIICKNRYLSKQEKSILKKISIKIYKLK